MRIAEVNDVASVATELTRGLRARGHEVDFIQPRLFGAQLHPTVKPAVSPVRAYEWAQLVRHLRAGAYDVVHIHYAYLGMVGWLGRFPYILHCHGSDLREMTAFTRPLTERAIRGAGHVFYSTPDLASFLGGRPDAEFLPNPIDADSFSPDGPAGARPSVFIACALDPIKGIGRILDACRILAASRPDIQFTAIAGGEKTDEFEALPNVRLLPRQPRSSLPQIIGDHGLVVGQVLLGVIGMAELEAMACGRPLVAWFAHREAYLERPPIVGAVDAADIAAAVAALVDDPARRTAAGDAGRAWVLRHHGLARIAERVEEVALGLTRGARRAAG